MAELDRDGERTGYRARIAPWPAEDLAPGAAGAAVTIVLRDGTRDVEVLLIERAVREHDLASGQVALPGGRADPTDASLAATALRELTEEVGLGAGDVVLPLRLVGIQRADLFGLDVAVFTAPLTEGPREPVGSPGEVAHVFWLPEAALKHIDTVERTTPRGTRTVPAVVHHGAVLWGFTLRVLRDFFGTQP